MWQYYALGKLKADQQYKSVTSGCSSLITTAPLTDSSII
jgi:hypothetical protein